MINIDTHSLLLDLDMYTAQISKLEKASGYKIEDLIQLFKNERITVLPSQPNMSEM